MNFADNKRTCFDHWFLLVHYAAAAAVVVLANLYYSSLPQTKFSAAPPSVVVEAVVENQVASLVLKQLSMLVQKHQTCRSVEIEHNHVK